MCDSPIIIIQVEEVLLLCVEEPYSSFLLWSCKEGYGEGGMEEGREGGTEAISSPIPMVKGGAYT